MGCRGWMRGVVALMIIGSVACETPPPEGPDVGGQGMPEDTFACILSDAGFCVFTGTPHPNGLLPGTTQVVDREGTALFDVSEALAANDAGTVLTARGTPAQDGDQLIPGDPTGLTEDEQAFHRVMAILFPIRNALMYDIETLTSQEWDLLTEELAKRGIKESTFTAGATPKDNYYGRQGIFELAKDPGGVDIHHPIMKFLEEAGLYLLCHVTSDEFAALLKETHPEGHDPCADAAIVEKVPF